MRKAFEIARGRQKKVTSIDIKMFATSKLWRRVADRVAQDFLMTGVGRLSSHAHNPSFDVIVTETSSDQCLLPGTLLLSAIQSRVSSMWSFTWIGSRYCGSLWRRMILSVAMMMRESFDREEDASRTEKAVKGLCCRDRRENSGGSAS